jgi:hypothetical protein
MLQPISQAVDRSVQGMIQGTTTAQQALRNINQSIVAEFINMIVRRTTEWIAGEMAQAAATRATAASNAAAKAAEANAIVSANAASAASGAASSQASIPYTGPVMAASSFASVMAMVLGAKSTIASAAGGYDIPSGVNPLTQLHQEEMVLPASLANKVRDMTDGGAGNTIHFNISAMDSKDVMRALEKDGALRKTMASMMRGFAY